MKLQTHKTASDTWRVLVDGKVHPLLVGFEDEFAAARRATEMFPHVLVMTTQHPNHPARPANDRELMHRIRAFGVDCWRDGRTHSPSPTDSTAEALDAIEVQVHKLQAELRQWRDVFCHLGTPDEVGNMWYRASDQRDETVTALVESLEDALGWIKTGEVDGVGFDEIQIVDALSATLTRTA